VYVTVGPGSVTVTVGPGSVAVTVTVTVSGGGGASVIVTVAVGVAVTVVVGQGRGLTLIRGLPRSLYAPLPIFFWAWPAPVVTGTSVVVLLQDLPLHARCLTLNLAAPSYLMETSR
jgi:hypothetical protein